MINTNSHEYNNIASNIIFALDDKNLISSFKNIQVKRICISCRPVYKSEIKKTDIVLFILFHIIHIEKRKMFTIKFCFENLLKKIHSFLNNVRINITIIVMLYAYRITYYHIFFVK